MIELLKPFQSKIQLHIDQGLLQKLWDRYVPETSDSYDRISLIYLKGGEQENSGLQKIQVSVSLVLRNIRLLNMVKENRFLLSSSAVSSSLKFSVTHSLEQLKRQDLQLYRLVDQYVTYLENEERDRDRKEKWRQENLEIERLRERYQILQELSVQLETRVSAQSARIRRELEQQLFQGLEKKEYRVLAERFFWQKKETLRQYLLSCSEERYQQITERTKKDQKLYQKLKQFFISSETTDRKTLAESVEQAGPRTFRRFYQKSVFPEEMPDEKSGFSNSGSCLEDIQNGIIWKYSKEDLLYLLQHINETELRQFRTEAVQLTARVCSLQEERQNEPVFRILNRVSTQLMEAEEQYRTRIRAVLEEEVLNTVKPEGQRFVQEIIDQDYSEARQSTRDKASSPDLLDKVREYTGTVLRETVEKLNEKETELLEDYREAFRESGIDFPELPQRPDSQIRGAEDLREDEYRETDGFTEEERRELGNLSEGERRELEVWSEALMIYASGETPADTEKSTGRGTRREIQDLISEIQTESQTSDPLQVQSEVLRRKADESRDREQLAALIRRINEYTGGNAGRKRTVPEIKYNDRQLEDPGLKELLARIREMQEEERTRLIRRLAVQTAVFWRKNSRTEQGTEQREERGTEREAGRDFGAESRSPELVYEEGWLKNPEIMDLLTHVRETGEEERTELIRSLAKQTVILQRGSEDSEESLALRRWSEALLTHAEKNLSDASEVQEEQSPADLRQEIARSRDRAELQRLTEQINHYIRTEQGTQQREERTAGRETETGTEKEAGTESRSPELIYEEGWLKNPEIINLLSHVRETEAEERTELIRSLAKQTVILRREQEEIKESAVLRREEKETGESAALRRWSEALLTHKEKNLSDAPEVQEEQPPSDLRQEIARSRDRAELQRLTEQINHYIRTEQGAEQPEERTAVRERESGTGKETGTESRSPELIYEEGWLKNPEIADLLTHVRETEEKERTELIRSLAKQTVILRREQESTGENTDFRRGTQGFRENTVLRRWSEALLTHAEKNLPDKSEGQEGNPPADLRQEIAGSGDRTELQRLTEQINRYIRTEYGAEYRKEKAAGREQERETGRRSGAEERTGYQLDQAKIRMEHYENLREEEFRRAVHGIEERTGIRLVYSENQKDGTQFTERSVPGREQERDREAVYYPETLIQPLRNVQSPNAEHSSGVQTREIQTLRHKIMTELSGLEEQKKNSALVQEETRQLKNVQAQLEVRLREVEKQLGQTEEAAQVSRNAEELAEQVKKKLQEELHVEKLRRGLV